MDEREETDRGASPDLSGCSLRELEIQLRQVDEAIRTVSMLDGVAGKRNRNMAIREVAVRSVRRREIVTELNRRREALRAWRADQELLVSSPTSCDP